MNTVTDLGKVDCVLPTTPARLQALQAELERANDEVNSALRRGGSPQRYRELCFLKTAVDAAQQVLASFAAHPD